MFYEWVVILIPSQLLSFFAVVIAGMYYYRSRQPEIIIIPRGMQINRAITLLLWGVFYLFISFYPIDTSDEFTRAVALTRIAQLGLLLSMFQVCLYALRVHRKISNGINNDS